MLCCCNTFWPFARHAHWYTQPHNSRLLASWHETGSCAILEQRRCVLLQESELTPTGANLLDGRYAVFGYVVDGADLLQECQVGDVFEYIKVTGGEQYLKLPVPHPKSSSGTI